ncbi:MAG: hypothetical protein M0P31_10340 [Solirubrobacteraceae bacterium]|nr:hypothetical protein [Solirubrobacteraceae bacterium]
MALFNRRSRRFGGTPFEQADLTGLTALAVARCPLPAGSPVATNALDNLQAWSQLILDDGHRPATDLVGLAWANAYGRLPLDDPPTAILEAILQAGARPGAVHGLLAGTMRLAFTAGALPFMNWRTRPIAEREHRRWTEYASSGLATLEPTGADTAQFSLAARATYFAADGARPGSGLHAQANALARRLASTLPQDAASAVVAQVAAAASASGAADEAIALLRQLVHRRPCDGEPFIARAAGDDRVETSPWIPLALASAGS